MSHKIVKLSLWIKISGAKESSVLVFEGHWYTLTRKSFFPFSELTEHLRWAYRVLQECVAWASCKVWSCLLKSQASFEEVR